LLTPKDTISQTYGMDGVTFCGPRIYQFTVPSLSPSKVVTFDTNSNTIIM
jgi:hypothetical protein